MMPTGKGPDTKLLHRYNVSILVLLDDAYRLAKVKQSRDENMVSILVLLDDAYRQI